MAKKVFRRLRAGEKMQREVYYITHYREELDKASSDEQRNAVRAEAVSMFLALRTESAMVAAEEFGFNHEDYLLGEIPMPAEIFEDAAEGRYQSPSSLVGLVGRAIGEAAGTVKKTVRKIGRYRTGA